MQLDLPTTEALEMSIEGYSNSIWEHTDVNEFENHLRREGYGHSKNQSRHKVYTKSGRIPITIVPASTNKKCLGKEVRKYLNTSGYDAKSFLDETNPQYRKNGAQWEARREKKKAREEQRKLERIENQKRLVEAEARRRREAEEKKLKDEALKERQITITQIKPKKERTEMNKEKTFIIKATRTIEQEVHYEVTADCFADAYNFAIEAADINEEPGELVNTVSGSAFNLEVFGCEEVREVA